MLDAWEIYNSKRYIKKVKIMEKFVNFFSRSVIMFIIEDVTYNICDQKFHEFKIRELNPDVFVIRKTLTEIAHEGKLDEGVLDRLIELSQNLSKLTVSHMDQASVQNRKELILMSNKILNLRPPIIHLNFNKLFTD